MNSLTGMCCFSRFMGSAQKPPDGHACAARGFICLCIVLGFWLLKPPGKDEYPPGGATVLRFSVGLRFVQGHWDF